LFQYGRKQRDQFGWCRRVVRRSLGTNCVTHYLTYV
jgi:hypothetical protein